ncbi:uncharacterized protein C9orf85 homolog [Colossoma macropomum]|uniref:uncharacterized protein C9orf85 homolog n=1 Tax=Colossoma macropomum TaxID=42526 RepID=UPI0018644C29|nr:uncharacterized protein C9orf85 homolog [Colossoma macropomum]
MSSQKGGGSRSRAQRYQNTTAFKNDKYGATPQVKKANAKVHEGLCQRCKDILEWKVKYNKYKFLTQPRKCVKCLQKTVKDAYHIMCKPCALRLELCAKCGKKEEIVLPLNRKEEEEEEAGQQRQSNRQKKRDPHRTDEDDDDFDDEEEDDFGELDSDCNECDTEATGK